MRRIVLGSITPLLLAMLLLPTMVAADCAIARMELSAVVPTATRLPIGAGIVVVPENAWSVAHDTLARELVGDRRIALSERTIAPDVTVLVPATAPTAGRYQVTGLREAVAIEFTSSPMPAPLAAPRLRTAAYASLGLDRHAGERFAATATLEGAPPEGAILLLARWFVSGRPAGTSFHRLTTGTTMQRIYESAEGCGSSPASVVAPPVGAVVDVAWVDAVGRVSPWSSRVAVTR